MRGREAGSVGRREYENIKTCLSGCTELFIPSIYALLSKSRIISSVLHAGLK